MLLEGAVTALPGYYRPPKSICHEDLHVAEESIVCMLDHAQGSVNCFTSLCSALQGFLVALNTSLPSVDTTANGCNNSKPQFLKSRGPVVAQMSLFDLHMR